MKNFGFIRADTVAGIWPVLTADPDLRYLGGGTNLVDLLRENIERPATLVDVTGVLSDTVQDLPDGGLRIGAAMRNSHLANDGRIKERYPLLSQAILNGASAQLRNMATTAGNLMQRTRCYYFYNSAARCNKRKPGQGCDALHGFNRIHAILGASDQCIATHPSDMCVALAALDATIIVTGPAGDRSIPIGEFHRLPGRTPEFDTTLKQGELITAVDLPAGNARRSAYRKVRDRASYAFALVSVAAVLELKNNRIESIRLALGGVAHKPWRAAIAEKALIGAAPEPAVFAQALERELESAKAYEYNRFKIPLVKQVVVAMLNDLALKDEA